jgi:hypothetical protein
LGLALIRNSLQQHLTCTESFLKQRLTNGSQPVHCRRGDIVKTRDADVLWHAKTTLPRLIDRAKSQFVIE